MALSRSGLIWCEDERRSGDVRTPSHPLNGIDFVEYRRDPAAMPDRRHRLEVTFLKIPAAALSAGPEPYAVIGGIRVVGIRVLSAEADPGEPRRLIVFLDREGDYSTYVLQADDASLDPELSQARFGFKASCPSDLDCRQRVDCPPETLAEPALDYMAKDYQSFRRLMLDLLPERNPGWTERLAADLGITLVELFAYAGDYLSYQQDAVATEGYLDTCLHRISAARHARLVDYRMHQGRNAFTFVHFAAQSGTDGIVPAGAKLLTRVGSALRGEPAPPGTVIPSTAADFDGDPALADATVFETTARIRVVDRHNALFVHAWGNAECCLAKGTREAYLYGLPATGASPSAFRPELRAGDYLLLEEVRSPITGLPADADAKRRQVVRLTAVEDTVDPAYRRVFVGRTLTPRSSPGQQPLRLQRVVWGEEDALAFPLCLSAETPEAGRIAPVSLARGNVAPADHGRTVVRELPPPDAGAGRWPLPSLALPDAPLTHQPMPAAATYAEDGRLIQGRHDLDRDVREGLPAVVLSLEFPGGEEERWEPVPHLLDSGPYAQHFVAEMDDGGAASLRFGDDQYGRRPLGAERATARYRIGNGRAGNIGSGALVHIVAPTAAELTDPANPGAGPEPFAAIADIEQPVPARLGTDPETIEQVRQLAPEAFRAVQYRAVTEADWQEAALRLHSVAAAKARFRWTGSWHTVFVAVHPREADDLVRLPGGGAALTPAFRAAVTAHLRRFKLAGYDLAVRAARYVPLEIAIEVCVGPGHFRGDVLEAVGEALSNRAFPDGTRGFFHPLAFGFGEPVYLSRLYAAVEAIAGVDSARVTLFKRYWEVERDELDRGVIETGAMEIARLDNDPSSPENGVLHLSAVGGL